MSVTVLGSINMDMVLRIAHLPQPGETIRAASVQQLPGGKGANQAVASARFGAPTRLFGAVGGDAHGTAMLDFLMATGVGVDHVAHVAGPTGLAYVFVSDAGENQIVILAGANDAVTAPAAWVPFGSRDVCLVQLEVPVPAVAAMLSLARRAGALTILNTAPALALSDAVLRDADVIILNEPELAFYLGTRARDPHSAGRLLQRDDQWVVVTLGAAGIVAVTRSATITHPAPPVAVIDTTGAGDTFCGVLAASLAEGLAMPVALRLACTAASLSVQRVGAAAAMPDRAEIEAALGKAAS